MPLQLTQADYGGLQAAANYRIGDLNLKGASALGGALAGLAAARRENREFGLEEQKLAMQRERHQQEMSLAREEMGLRRKRMEQEQKLFDMKTDEMGREMAAKESQESIEKRAAGAYAWMQMTPEQKADPQVRSDFAAHLQSQGLFNEQEAEMFVKAPASQVDNFARVVMASSKSALNYMKPQSNGQNINVNVDTGKYAEQQAKNNADIMKGIREDADKANQSLAAIPLLREANQQYKTGLFSPAKELAGRAIQGTTGADPFNVKYADVLQSLSTQEVMSFVQQSKGSISDKEMDLFMKASVSLSKTTEGNEKLINMKEGLARRQVQRAEFYEAWAKQNNGSLDGASTAWSKYVNENPLLDKEMNTLQSQDHMLYLDGKSHKQEATKSRYSDSEISDLAKKHFGGDINKAKEAMKAKGLL